MIWLDRFLEIYAAEVAWCIVGLLCVWIIILERRRQKLEQELKRTQESAESFRQLARDWGEALQESRQRQPTVIPCATLVRRSGDNGVVLAEVCLN